ncbi:purine-nucleoside phosphorylase [Salsuginibacillus halophilus]|uniref:Purine nucleoside phosphorylase n=1 Tax=Salsuginibacillus halophilus TaxID=517424 RepID=A0A2P8HAP4_9BACI|nr:purine-nucleoside phosphorylase [Salsuginibacillus halophilus]PSL43293.1 purine-nucleoside phosphorylase [Salsuginibacillus halophilus]
MKDMKVHVHEAAKSLQQKLNNEPKVGLILGSGLGDLAEEIENPVKTKYEDIPHFPVSTVEGHAGQLVAGSLEGQEVIAMQGRFHYYEGYSMQDVTFPVRVMKELGVEKLIVTNACGGMNPSFQPGDLMIIEDHINMTGDNPLMGPNDEELGPRFPDMSTAYSKELRDICENAAESIGFSMQKGVYVGISGPTFMSAAELKMLRKLGGDTVGMSTVPEVIVARHAGIEVLGISCITDMAVGEEIEGVSHDEVIETATKAKPRFIQLVKQTLSSLA